jgi:hypothetical protein
MVGKPHGFDFRDLAVEPEICPCRIGSIFEAISQNRCCGFRVGSVEQSHDGDFWNTGIRRLIFRFVAHVFGKPSG